MITMTAYLVSVTPGSRVAQMAIEGRGIARIPLTREQEAELTGREGKEFVVSIGEVGTLVPLMTEETA